MVSEQCLIAGDKILVVDILKLACYKLKSRNNVNLLILLRKEKKILGDSNKLFRRSARVVVAVFKLYCLDIEIIKGLDKAVNIGNSIL